ncbi:MAG: type II toxin-antitoxin system RelE/ParE family toxin [Lachnospiraceae bacterium]|nr:type II toxin-antitoxin system RelE/ParE family toxin [Lachnospiraceae bacterium]
MAFRKYDFYITETAEEDINEAFSYIKNALCNPEAAISFADELEIKIEDICMHPQNGRPVVNEYLKIDNIRRILVKNYTVYYTIDEEQSRVIVLRVVYGKRNQDDILKGF